MDYNRFYVIRTKMRADGDVDFEKKEVYTLASAYNQFYTFKAEAFIDTTYPQIAVCILNHEMRQLESCCVTTSYVAPVGETAEESAE